MSNNPLEERFPEMRPIQSAPSLQTVNGIGTTVVGRRDFDVETETYVKTHVFSFFFVPLLALGAYRVADAPGGGWYFLGKVPLSGFARTWNLMLLLAIVSGVGSFAYLRYTSTPSYQLARKMAQADQLVAAGQIGQAARLYHEVMNSKTDHARTARDRLRQSIESPTGSLTETAGAYQVAVDMHRRNDILVPDLFARGKELALKGRETDARGAMELLEAISPLADRPADLLGVRKELLEKLVRETPDDIDLASRLAVVYEATGQHDQCEKLLAPFADRLGERDAAAILGRVYAGKGEHDKAIQLLEPLLNARLPNLQRAEKRMKEVGEQVEKSLVEELKSGKAPGFDYNRYEAAAKEQKGAMINAWMRNRLMEDANLRAAQEELRAQEGVVRIAMDLGIVLLQRARQLGEAGTRRNELERAEKVFLSVRDVAGESTGYQLYLGQVYYWLGKPAEGRKLFDNVLASTKRSSEMLLAIGHTLREVGAVSEARPLMEEAYNKETDLNRKQDAALTRSLVSIDLDDRIKWLERAKPDMPEVRASLSDARGRKAAEEGKDAEAIRHYREAIEVYNKQPENEATLNNSAIVHFALFTLTHDREDFVRGAARMDRAIKLKSSDTILLHNAGNMVLQGAVAEVLGNSLDLKALKQPGGADLLPYLYRNAQEKQKVVEALGRHPGLVQARGYLERLVVLAPKNSRSWAEMAWLYELFRDKEQLSDLRERLQKVELDLADDTKETLEYYAGKDDPKRIEQVKQKVKRREQRVESARKVGGRTLAVALASLVAAQVEAAIRGQRIDVDAAVKMAEEAHALAPSDGTRSVLADVLRHRAHRKLIQQVPAYAALAGRTQRSLSDQLLNWVLSQPGELRDRALALPDVKRGMALRRERLEQLPEDCDPSLWAFLSSDQSEAVRRFAQTLVDDPFLQDQRTIAQILSPLSASNVLDAYWVLQMAGKEDKAREVLQAAARKKIPLPVAEK
jgi:tetratricopeptide (TPR) repeat protein